MAATRPLLSLSFFLLAVRLSLGVKCTLEEYNPCRCVLTDGYRGYVDLSPIFKNGPLDSNTIYYKYFKHLIFNPCVANQSYTGIWEEIYNTDPTTFYFCGHMAGLNRELEVSQFDPENTEFEFVMSFRQHGDYGPLEVMYEFSTKYEFSHILNYNSAAKNPEQGIHLKVHDRHVYPLILPEGDTVGSYTVEEDVCAGWQVQRTLLGDIGLLGLASPVVILSTMKPHDEFFVGVCANPLKDSKAGDDCFALKRTGNDSVELCIGRSIGVQMTDQRDQGWIVLKYPFGDFLLECNGYASTEIFFTCSHSDQPISRPLYPENNFEVVCNYHFIWPTHLACPNVTSPSESPSPSNASSILLGMSGSIAVLLLLVLVGVSIASCYFCTRPKTKH